MELAHTSRLRSHSSPVRPAEDTYPPELAPESDHTSSVQSVEGEAPERQPHWRSFYSSPPAASDSSRKLFRLKRPSSSSAAMDPNYTSDFQSASLSTTSQPSSRGSGSRSNSRPSTSSGIYERPLRVRSSSSVSESRRDPSIFRAFGPVMGHTGTDFGLQRKKSRSGKPPKPANQITKVSEDTAGELQSSTPDRTTVVEDFRRMMKARDDQFVLKNGKKHHPYPPKEVPYPRSYERQAIDSDIWEGMWAYDVCARPTWSTISEPTGKVLDLGCGSGSWILACAGHWTKAHFVGLDIVPIQPDLTQTGSTELANRVTWVQANFLEGLPFLDEEFDFVHAKRIGRGIPEDKWDALLEDIHRILKPGGVLELFEEELTFPGRAVHEDELDTIDLMGRLATLPSSLSNGSLTDDSRSSGSSSFTTLPLHLSNSPPRSQRDRNDLNYAGSPLSFGLMSPMAMPGRPARPASPTHARAPDVTDQELLDSIIIGRNKPKVRALFDPRDHSFLEHIYNEMHSSRFINLAPLALLASSLFLIFSEVATHPPIIFTFPPKPVPNPAAPGYRKDQEVLTLADVAKRATPYVVFDENRAKTAYRPRRASNLSGRPSISGPPGAADPSSNMPSVEALAEARASHDLVPLWDMICDLRTLNLHLAVRVQDILGCAEEMWRWVLDYQETHPARTDPSDEDTIRGGGARMRGRAYRPYHDDLVNLRREEFDQMLMRFRLDMEDHVQLSSAVCNRLAWPPVRSPVPPERVEFEELCAVWAKHQDAVAAPPAASSDSTRSNGDSRSSSSLTIPSEDSLQRPFPPGRQEQCPRTLSSLPPTERISRTVRSFVAWKAGP